MELVGAGVVDVPSCPDGPRNWPAGIVGSVSHKGTLTLVAVAFATRWIGLGIDLEQLDRSDLSEIDGLDAGELPPGPLAHAAKLHILFSVKEAVFKAVFPLDRRPVGFGEIMPGAWSASGHELRALTELHGHAVQIAVARTESWIVSSAIINK